MPLGKKVRPTSAMGKLETFHITSVLEDIRPATVKATSNVRRAQTSKATSRTSAPLWQFPEFKKTDQPPEWLERELLKQQHRRHSISLDEDLSEAENVHRSVDPARSLQKLKIEERVSLENLQKLKVAFEEFEKNGGRSLDVANFRRLVKKCLGLRGISDEQIEELFKKIDYSANNNIDWDEFCTFMQLEFAEKEESVARKKEVSFILPATVTEISHGEPVLNIRSAPDNTVITVREDGTINYWSPELKLKRSKTVFDRPLNRTPKWVTDFTTMSQYNKLILGTGDREIQLYELSSLEPYCQVSGLETVPLRLDYCGTDIDECIILYGDDQGSVNVLIIKSVGEILRTWKKLPKVENIPNIGLESALLSDNISFIHWKVHDDWVTQIKYYDCIRAVISTSNHENSALVIGCTVGTTNVEQQMKEIKEICKDGKLKKGLVIIGPPQKRAEWDQTVFRVYKGVKTYDFCKDHNLLVTGGMDRIIRMWNPYVPGKPTGILRGHTAPVFYLHISSEDSRIYSVSSDNTVKIWDIQDQSCLFTANPKATRIRGDIFACHFAPALKTLYIATDSLAYLSLRIKPQPQPHLIVSHKEPVLCCRYNNEFRQVVSCTEGSVVKVWDYEKGNQVFEFCDAHDDSAITCMAFDNSGRRLVTGGRDGCLKIWNFNNGHCLRTLKKDGNSDEVSDCIYVTMNRNRYVMAVGWDRRIDIYFDQADDLHHVQKPQLHWQDDLRRGHKEDILCIAQCPPNLLATGSYDGEIIVWNMVSGHIYCRLRTPLPQDCSTIAGIDKSVSKVIFLKSCAKKNESTSSLVSSGPQGYINFWNLMNGGKLMGTFQASRFKLNITSIAVSADNLFLYAADQAGYVYVYNIQQYALLGPEQESPKMVNYWRAHLSNVTSLEIIDEDKIILSSSTDCTVRLWSTDGEFIGTFGQPEPWNIYTKNSWKHPAIPYEILVDPLSMPVHQVLQGESSVLDVINNGHNDSDATKAEPQFLQKFSRLLISDEDINEEINKVHYPQGCGKRLRHEIYKDMNKPPNHGGPKAYHMLKYFEVNEVPSSYKKPDLSAAGTDPFLSNDTDNNSKDVL
ncbi:WD repeat-containing protein on Y chromosome [Polypterus senegalus]|uniref:WD repeat-containing protein on Y chromosome n=1 Tax=Polypterus senegalus TaxID=55291 RepID=UPI00196335AA|nr:WD repeat-containing protein on Y chromosome [Polypterus senegalus]